VDARFPDFADDAQHDAIEFLNSMLDILGEDFKKEIDMRRPTSTVLIDSGENDEKDLADRRW
jgi:ubiquitin C-terminal hydrolase